MLRPLRKIGLFALAGVLLTGVAFAATSMDEALMAKFKELETQYQLPQGILAKVAKIESNGNASAGQPGAAYGLFQWMPGSWYDATKALYGAPKDLSLRANPLVAAEVTAFALGQTKSNLGGLIQQAKVDLALGLYMGHFLGSGGAKKFFQLFIQNPNADATSLFPKEAAYNRAVFNGRTLAGVLNFFAQKMQAPGITGVSNYSTTYSGTDITSGGRIMDTMGSTMLARPFTGPVPPPDPNRTYQTDYTTGDIKNVPNTAATSSPATAGAAAAAILVQPKSISRGGTIVVSWTSVQMASNSCKVFYGNQEFATGSEGSKPFPTVSSDSGAQTFTLQCTDKAGQIYTSTGTSNVQ